MTNRDDMVQHPPHYIEGRRYETLSVAMDWYPQDPLLWQVLKYISRAGRKPNTPALQDLQKAKFYLERAIEREETK